MTKVAPTLRDRQVFIAMMNEFISALSAANANFPTTQTHLKKALADFEYTTALKRIAEDKEFAALKYETDRTDYRE